MKALITAALLVLGSASITWAGLSAPVAAPAMDEVGLIMLGLSLAGGGVALLRRK